MRASVIKRPRLQTPEVIKKNTETDRGGQPIRDGELVSSDTLTCCLPLPWRPHSTEGEMQIGRGVGRGCFSKPLCLQTGVMRIQHGLISNIRHTRPPFDACSLSVVFCSSNNKEWSVGQCKGDLSW